MEKSVYLYIKYKMHCYYNYKRIIYTSCQSSVLHENMWEINQKIVHMLRLFDSYTNTFFIVSLCRDSPNGCMLNVSKSISLFLTLAGSGNPA